MTKRQQATLHRVSMAMGVACPCKTCQSDLLNRIILYERDYHAPDRNVVLGNLYQQWRELGRGLPSEQLR